MSNFISIETPSIQRQEGLQDYKIRVCELSEKEAYEYGELMKQAFIQHHKEHLKREAEERKKAEKLAAIHGIPKLKTTETK